MLHIATSREIGKRCIEWAESRYPLTSAEKCDIFISVLYDKIIPQSFIDKRICFNFHPGILPDYRGSGAYSWVLINEERETGVTLHMIDKGIDTGDLIDIRTFPITESDNAGTLFAKAEDLIFEMFQDWLSKLVEGEFFAEPQRGGTIYYRRDLEKAKDLTRYRRAFTFPYKERAFYYTEEGKKIYI